MIQWNKVTWYSKLLAVVVFVATFGIAFYLGAMYQATMSILISDNYAPASVQKVEKQEENILSADKPDVKYAENIAKPKNLKNQIVANPINYKDVIEVIEVTYGESPLSGTLFVKGKARGTWFFEASFGMRLEDNKGNNLVQGSTHGLAVADGEWMTEEYVSFNGQIATVLPQVSEGVLILEKSNPSDLRHLDDELRIPVLFDT